jgi:hypothetical protein
MSSIDVIVSEGPRGFELRSTISRELEKFKGAVKRKH